MKNIFIAFIFILFDFAITLGSCRIGLIPTCVGYWFLGKGIGKLAEKSPSCQKIVPYIKPMMIFTAVLYVLDLLGLSESIITFLLGLVALAVMLYISYHIVKGVQELQQVYHGDLNGGKLYATWKMLTILTIAVHVLVFVPLLNIALMLSAFIANILFLVALYHSMEMYDVIPKNRNTYNDIYPPKVF